MRKLILMIILSLSQIMLWAQPHPTRTEWDGLKAFFTKIEGNWQAENSTSFESWNFTNDQFSGAGYQIRENDTLYTEKLRVFNHPNGKPVYEATVADQNDGLPVIFELTLLNRHKVVFENPAHDFPNRITYDLEGSNLLIVTVIGKNNDKTNSFTIRFKKIK